MQAVLLLAGKNSRFFPLETMGHKVMIKIYGRPLLSYVIDDLKEAGIKDIVIVNGKYADVVKNYFGNGEKFGVNIKYAIQQEPLGQGDALLSAIDLIDSDFIVPDPYHFYQADIFKEIINKFKEKNADAVIPGKRIERTWEYGILKFDGDKIKGIVEKPPQGTEPSNFKATSAYVFKQEFIELLKTIPQAEYSYEEAIDKYAQSHDVYMYEIAENKYIPTLKYPWHLLEIRDQIAKNTKGFIHPTAKVSPTAIIDDTVYIDEGAQIFEYATVKGNTYIGKNAVVGNYSLVRDLDLGEGSVVGAFSDVARSIIMDKAKSHGGGFVGDSIVGINARLAAGVVTGNKRMDRANITAIVKDKEVDTGVNSMGMILGKETNLGINTMIMPGKMIGANCNIWPGAIVTKNIPHNSSLKFNQNSEIISND